MLDLFKKLGCEKAEKTRMAVRRRMQFFLVVGCFLKRFELRASKDTHLKVSGGEGY